MSENRCDCNCLNTGSVEMVKGVMPSSVRIDMLADFFKAFGDGTRLKIICVLDKVNELCVCDIANAIGMTKSAVSHQLKYLRKLRFVKSRKDGKVVYYSLADNHVKDLYEIGMEHIGENE